MRVLGGPRDLTYCLLRERLDMSIRIRFATVLAVSVGLGGFGCGSKWRLHEESRVEVAKMTSTEAPEWVRRGPACMEGLDPTRLYFVGRSHSPDFRRENQNRGSSRVVAERVGFTVLDERDAVQSARNDVYDQVRQRLSPRNYGMSAQTIGMSIDSGVCVGCDDEVPLLYTAVEQPCNDMCLRDGIQSCSSGSCGSQVSAGQQVAALPPGTPCGVKGQACAGSCAGGSGTVGKCGSSCDTCMSRMVRGFRKADYLPVDLGQMARDLNLLNIGVDSVMPALLAGMEEEEVYFERWWVHEGDDPFGRGLAEGDDEWQSYKAWILFSIPREEFAAIADQFRSRYDSLLATAMEWAVADRERRIQLEMHQRSLQQQWQQQEREWNREDELAALEHARMVDLDRIHFPGRRFSVVGGR